MSQAPNTGLIISLGKAFVRQQRNADIARMRLHRRRRKEVRNGSVPEPRPKRRENALSIRGPDAAVFAPSCLGVRSGFGNGGIYRLPASTEQAHGPQTRAEKQERCRKRSCRRWV